MIQQIKSHWYYVFWGICTVSVLGGQLYVGLGYREMAEATKSTDIRVTCEIPYQISTVPYKNRTREFE